MSVLVTGGAGYIGSHVVAALQYAGESVVVLDNFSTGTQEAVLDVNCISGDVGDSDHVHRILRQFKVESIVHLAGSIKVDESVLNPTLYYRNNTINSMKLIEAAVNEGVKHLVFSSTAAVYGTPAENPVAETAPTNPVSPYGFSKLMVEQALRDIGRASNLRHLSLRYFNVAGAHPNGRLGYSIERQPTHLIRAALQAALEGTPFTVFGSDYPTPDGTCMRDFIHVWDLANAHVNALEYLRNRDASGVLNCGYGRGYSVLEVLTAVCNVAGTNFTVRAGPRREGDPAAVFADARRIRETLQWVPEYDNLDIIVRHQFEWEKSRRIMAS